MLTPALYERMGREADRLARVVNDWTACATCNSETGARIEFVEDYDAFIEVYCKDCGVTADRGITNAGAILEELLQGRLHASQLGQLEGYDKLQQKSLSRRVLHYWWAARNVAARSFR